MSMQQLQAYAHRIRELLRANPNTPETGLAPAFQRLVTDLLPLLPAIPQLTVSPEYNSPGVGRPDIALIRRGQPARAFIELKAPTKYANPERWRDVHDTRQRERLKELGAWSASNFADFHLFARDKQLGSAAIVPPRALQPDTPDAAADRLVAEHDPAAFLDLLATLARADAPIARDAPHLAELMAHSARLVRGAVQERVSELHGGENARHPLILVRETFRNVLYAHPEAGGYSAADFDTLFSSAFAQTLAFGLLLVREALFAEEEARVRQEGGPGRVVEVGPDSWRHMPDEHPLMKATLEILSDVRVSLEVGIGFEVMCDTVNSFAPEVLALQPDGRDPILYFYENFLQTFDPAARERYGVYYTPIEVVRYMTGALDRALRDNLGTQGLRDPDVTILDPATGTGTFLLGIAERVRDQVTADAGGVEASMALGDLARRMYGFELLVGPYAVAHYRLHHALRNRPADEGEDVPQPVNLPRLGVYLADTLADPDAITPIGGLGIQGIPIDDERREANRIKTQQPILAIIGNPPYKGLRGNERETLVGRWIAGGTDENGNPVEGLWDDLKRPVSDAGHGNELNTFEEFSVAFWRWAIWKLFEANNAPNKGVIAFITNRKFLTGWPYAGLREMLRERFDRIEIIDLRGDVRRGERGDVEADQGVFNIMVGTAITVAIADGSKARGSPADVRYTDCWTEGLFSRRAKLDFLVAAADDGRPPHDLPITGGSLDNFRPAPFQNGEWVSLREAFSFAIGGMQTKRNAFVYAVRRRILADRIAAFHRLDIENAATIFRETRDRSAAVAHAQPFDESRITATAFRPLDVRMLYRHSAFGDFLRPALQAAWGDSNIGLYSHRFGVGAGPAAWAHALLPDYDLWSGRGGYTFPLYDRREGPDATNISPAIVVGLSDAYGKPVAHQDVFDAILALLSASSYTRRFAEDLEDAFPHIPFPADRAVFVRAAELGREIRAVETFVRPATERFRPRGFCRTTSEPAGAVAGVTYRDGEIALCADGSGRITGIPQAVWDFSVSGYRVLPRWIEGRTGLPADLALVRELRDVAARVAELIHWFNAADIVLDETLAHTLTREALGFPAPRGEDEQEGDD